MKLEKILLRIRNDGIKGQPFTVAPSMLLVTILYLVALLSIPLHQPQRIIWMAVYPILVSEITGIGFFRIFIRSLWILPLVVLIGLFNPLIERDTAFRIGNVDISTGWVSFISIILRGILSFQAVLLLVYNIGFINIFNSLRRIHCPKLLSTQLLLTYRYISVVIEEALVMKRAREARGFGRKSYPLKDWSRFVGSLLLISAARATKIHQAMKARGFDGTLPLGKEEKWNLQARLWLIGWSAVFILLRFLDISYLFTSYINSRL